VFYFFFHVCRVIGKPETWIYNFDATHLDDTFFLSTLPKKGAQGQFHFKKPESTMYQSIRVVTKKKIT
jgi:hypothetical protein